MPLFEIEVVNALGQTHRIQTEAESREKLRQEVEELGYQVVAIGEVK